MSASVSSMPNLRARENFQGEHSRRRPSFRSGCEIQLSDGQIWNLPAPPTNSERNGVASDAAYIDIIRAIMESEDVSERCVAELAFAILLLQSNYHLGAADYQRLLGSSARGMAGAIGRRRFMRSRWSTCVRI